MTMAIAWIKILFVEFEWIWTGLQSEKTLWPLEQAETPLKIREEMF